MISMKKLFKKIYYKYFAPIQYHTVVLRGALTKEQRKYVNNHFSFTKNIKNTFATDKADIKFLEIGFGNGSHLKYLGENFRDKKYSVYGLELDYISIVRLLKIIDNSKIENVKVIREDARTFITNIPKKFFDTIFILYSDPWTRKRDIKRRLVNKDFLTKCLEKIKDNGQVILATDIETYQTQMENILYDLQNENKVNFTSAFEGEREDLQEIFKTKFALRAKREGRRNKVFVVNKIN